MPIVFEEISEYTRKQHDYLYKKLYHTTIEQVDKGRQCEKNFALESFMNEMARATNINEKILFAKHPSNIRLRNIIKARKLQAEWQ